MRKMMIAAVATFALAGVAACSSQADKEAEVQADALEQQAAAAPTEAQETALNEKADMVEQQAVISDGAATTENTPNSSPSATPANPNQ